LYTTPHYYIYIEKQQDDKIPVGPYPVIENRGDQIVPVVQAYAFCKYLGKLVLTFDSEKRLVSAVGGPILLDQTVPQGRYNEYKLYIGTSQNAFIKCLFARVSVCGKK